MCDTVNFKERKKLARKADLFSFLMRYHRDDVIQEGHFLRLKCDTSIVVKEGHSGFTKYDEDPKTGHGNGVDLLTRYLRYPCYQAIIALSSEHIGYAVTKQAISTSIHSSPLAAQFPPVADTTSRVVAYLTKTRGLSLDVVQALLRAGLLYQDQPHGNAVFINHDKDYCEIRGTCSFSKPFHGCRKQNQSGYWSFRVGHGNVKSAYICEAAVDAISLYELQRASGCLQIPAMYCSIGGVSNQYAIDRIASNPNYRTILAVDHDISGLNCIDRNPHLSHILPIHKDWNEDLLNR